MKKLLALLLALTMCMSMVSIASAEAAKPVITVAIADNLAIEDYNTNVMTLRIEDELGVDLQFQTYAATDFTSKINMMMASGGSDLQDILIVEPSMSEILTWVDSGNLIPLTQYYEDAAISPNLHEAVERTGIDFFRQVTMYDGEIYTIPQVNQSWAMEYPYRPYYNSEWLAQLGMEAPTTTDELYELLVKVKETDLNGNGINDEVGMLGNFRDGGWHFPGWFQYMMNAFVYAGDTKYFTVTDGTVGVAYNTDAWKEGLKYIHRMFAEKLIPQEVLTMDNDQFSAMLNTADPSTMMFFYTSVSQVKTENAWRDVYEAKKPLMGPNGRLQTTYRPSTATDGFFFITKNCENPELAFRVGDLLCNSYNSISTRFGQEGIDWDYIENAKVDADIIEMLKASMDEGVPLNYVVYDDGKFWSSGEMQNRSWRQNGPYVRSYMDNRSYAMVKLSQANADTSSTMYQEGKWGPAEVIPKLLYSADEIDATAEIQATLNTFVYEWTVNFLSGNLDIDANWDAYLNELNVIGLNELLPVVQTVYDRMYK